MCCIGINNLLVSKDFTKHPYCFDFAGLCFQGSYCIKTFINRISFLLLLVLIQEVEKEVEKEVLVALPSQEAFDNFR